MYVLEGEDDIGTPPQVHYFMGFSQNIIAYFEYGAHFRAQSLVIGHNSDFHAMNCHVSS